VAKQHGDVAEFVVLVPMDRVVIFGKSLLEQIAPEAVDLGKSLANEPKELGVCLFLRATLDNHRRKFRLHASWEFDFHQLMHSFFRIGARHDCQVDGSPQVDQIRIRLILDLHSLLFLVLLIFGALIFVVVIVIVFIVACLPKNLRLEPLVRILVLLPLRIKFEDVEAVLYVNFAV
jgi:hypothetical protein